MAQKQQHHLVKWEIDIYADNPREVAIEALKIMRDVHSEALFFDVHNTKNNSEHAIDLSNELIENTVPTIKIT